MNQLKALLYCVKAKPYLYEQQKLVGDTFFTFEPFIKNKEDIVNGKIVAECDFEVEEIFEELYGDLDWQHDYLPTTDTMSIVDLERKSCLNREELINYLKDKGYAIHIKNLHIFDEPKELSEYYSREKKMNTFDGYEWVCESIDKAPQNMMYAQDEKEKQYILISIKPEWLCKILNGDKTIEVRKKVLKEMLK